MRENMIIERGGELLRLERLRGAVTLLFGHGRSQYRRHGVEGRSYLQSSMQL